MPNFLDIKTIESSELKKIIQTALEIKKSRSGFTKGALDSDKALEGEIVALIFEKPSTRTRISFDVGVRQMGGQTIVLSGKDMQLGHGETIADTARVLSRYVDLIMLRTYEEATLHEMAQFATVPVINGLTNFSHPCQIMADILTYEEHRGSIEGKKIVWSGDGNNVFNSYAHAAEKFNFNLTFTGPETLEPDRKLIEQARQNGTKIYIEIDPAAAMRDADLVVTDTWISMHDLQSARERRHNQLRPYQVNKELIAHARPDALFMHCLPAHRDEEATSEIMDGKNSVIFDEAENRLHIQKAIMRWCLDK
ncbi:ornithine carbamoyltransferase [Paracoccaceae bacterium]|nr:ornithine carbamoyltransferase [Paracoccaceae bacterium]|tara:strand:+ start:730 stop:1656 length:927 start_codon:yes stop_codon:yes gene_type:complete